MLSPSTTAGLRDQRLVNWCQTPDTRIPDPDAAAAFIDRVGIATLFPTSPEIPDLFHAHLGDPAAPTEAGWDTPSGHVYGWRWALGRRKAAFYTAIVRRRPTWVAWSSLPVILRLRADLRAPDELYERGELSADARRIVAALEAAGDALATGDLRRAAGFPTGKPQRAAFLRAVAELDERLILAKVFAADPSDLDMRHALVSARYPDAVSTAESLPLDDALDRFLETYLPHAAYASPTPLARHLGLSLAVLRGGLERLAADGRVVPVDLPGVAGGYAWVD